MCGYPRARQREHVFFVLFRCVRADPRRCVSSGVIMFAMVCARERDKESEKDRERERERVCVHVYGSLCARVFICVFVCIVAHARFQVVLSMGARSSMRASLSTHVATLHFMSVSMCLIACVIVRVYARAPSPAGRRHPRETALCSRQRHGYARYKLTPSMRIPPHHHL